MRLGSEWKSNLGNGEGTITYKAHTNFGVGFSYVLGIDKWIGRSL